MGGPCRSIDPERTFAERNDEAEQLDYANANRAIANGRLGEPCRRSPMSEDKDQILVERWARVPFGNAPLQLLAARHLLDLVHGVIDQLANAGRFGLFLQVRLARLGRQPSGPGPIPLQTGPGARRSGAPPGCDRRR